MSRIGKKPVELPTGVSASVSGQMIEVKGPKGTRSFKATDDVTIAVNENAVAVTPRGSSKRALQQWGYEPYNGSKSRDGCDNRVQKRT